MYVCIYIYVCMYVCMYVYIYICPPPPKNYREVPRSRHQSSYVESSGVWPRLRIRF